MAQENCLGLPMKTAIVDLIEDRIKDIDKTKDEFKKQSKKVKEGKATSKDYAGAIQVQDTLQLFYSNLLTDFDKIPTCPEK